MSAISRRLIATLSAINGAGMLGLGWFAAQMVTYDGVMVLEVSISAGLIAIMAALTVGGLVLARRGRSGAAIALLAVAALPTLAAFGFLIYLEANPIDWR